MGKIKRYKNAIERFLSGESGQRFFNFAYSIGAAIVIWGALFKILHLPGGNTLLCIGMGTEVLMFILTAFDRPGRDYHWEDVFPVFNTKNPEDRPDFSKMTAEEIQNLGTDDERQEEATVRPAVASAAATTVPGVNAVAAPAAAQAPTVTVSLGDSEAMNAASTTYASEIEAIAGELRALKENTEALNKISTVLLDSYRAITENSDNITASSTGYVEQMEALNRNVAGLNTIYEIQLKSVSSQLDAIDSVNRGIKEISRMYETTAAKSELYCEQTEKMAENMRQLNHIYEKMLHAMTVNMYRPMPGAEAAEA